MLNVMFKVSLSLVVSFVDVQSMDGMSGSSRLRVGCLCVGGGAIPGGIIKEKGGDEFGKNCGGSSRNISIS